MYKKFIDLIRLQLTVITDEDYGFISSRIYNVQFEIKGICNEEYIYG